MSLNLISKRLLKKDVKSFEHKQFPIKVYTSQTKAIRFVESANQRSKNKSKFIEKYKKLCTNCQIVIPDKSAGKN